MFRIHRAVILVLMALAIGAAAQTAGTTANPGLGNTAAQPLIRILAPGAGVRLAQSFVQVNYELTNPAATPSPSFRVQLDDRDPEITAVTSITFTGLNPGKHTVAVELVDANNVPVGGARAQISFNTVAPGPEPSEMRLHLPDPLLVRAALQDPVMPLGMTDGPPPSAAGALPLLSVIGFGVLLGGIASAMKTR